MILSGIEIKKKKIITPCHPRTKHHTGLSYGIGPASIDLTVEFDSNGDIDYRMVYPGEFFLASTIEKFKMPKDYAARCMDKSTWARRGLFVQNTFIDPGFKGWLTLELTYHGDKEFALYRGTPICQIVFEKVEGDIELYEGKYNFGGKGQPRGPVEAI